MDAGDEDSEVEEEPVDGAVGVVVPPAPVPVPPGVTG